MKRDVLVSSQCTYQIKFSQMENVILFSLSLDCRRGQSLVVWAIHEGRQCARQVDADLNLCHSSLAGPGGIVNS